MPLPRIAIVGRPNAGKSSLMNMIAGAKVSIVDPTPGVTRDRVSAIVDVPAPFKSGKPKTVEFVDTGGFGVYVAEGGRYDEIGSDLSKLTGSIEDQIARAVDDADLILFAIDVQNGVTPFDREIATLLREGAYGAKRDGKKGDRKERKKRKTPPVRVVATKTDGPKWELHTAELAALGFGEPLTCSARTNYFRREFMDAIYELMPDTKDEEKTAAKADLMVAIVGKRNAGKSTLVNTLAGEPRMIVSEIAGTTRDAVDVRFEFDGKSMVAIDTAGLRRKRSFQSMIEHYAFDRVQRSIDRAEVVLMMIDASDKISQVDEHLAQLVAKSYKPAIIVVNKWDAVEGKTDDHGRKVTVERYETYIRGELKGLAIAPIAFISGKSGRNVKDTMRLAFELKAQSYERVTTGKLNRLVRGILETRGPTDTVGTMAKVYYVAQTGIAPPTITMVVNHPDLFTSNYLRFLINRFREELPFTEVPMRIVVRARRQREDDLYTADGKDEAGGPRRVGTGMKGKSLRGTRLAEQTKPVEGAELLDDAHSIPVDIDALGDDAAEFFDD